MEDVNQCKINALPDSILLQVLSLLPIKDAVKTGVLSRRWSHLWSFMPTLNFNEGDFSSKMKAELVTIVDRHLLCHTGGVRCFNLSVNFARVSHAMHVRRWMSHLAVTRKVEVVRILLHTSAKCINLRLNSFDCSSILALELKGCYFESPLSDSVVLGSLKTLTLRGMTLLGSKLLSMLQGCPLLQCLNMENCSELGDVNVSSLRLTNLTITSCEDMKLLEIDTPQLKYFKFHCHGLKLNKSGVSKLVAALTHLKALKACGCFLQTLSCWERMIENHQFSNLEELAFLECERKDFQASIPYLLLKCSPGLRKIIINSEQCCDFFSSLNSNALFWPPVFQLPRLQDLKIELFKGTNSEVKLLEYFVNNASLLESVKITISSTSKNMWSFVTNEVLRLQRGHPCQKMKIV